MLLQICGKKTDLRKRTVNKKRVIIFLGHPGGQSGSTLVHRATSIGTQGFQRILEAFVF